MTESKKPNKEEQTLEASFQILDGLVEKLESPEITLEDSFRIYQQGMELLKVCNSKIDGIEKKMLVMNKKGDLSEF
ncbi:MAG: exodeoxyribonuclease VII small subunit [Lachnospiraceae bacterium]|nr:exodeoxyribonuclease VII small subunit [Lachnospiraceae bacterium]